MTRETREKLIGWAETYNDPKYFETDPIAFPTKFVREGASLQDIEVASVFAAHFAWGRRQMIVRDCNRLFDEMNWRPYDYVMARDWRNDGASIHRTVKWSEVAAICSRLYDIYSSGRKSLEDMSVADIRKLVFGQKEDPKAANKKINMMRRWLVRNDGKVDLGVWKKTSPTSLVIPLDVHVYDVAAELGLTSRHSKDIVTAIEITGQFNGIFPGDPVKGDFALFGYGVTHSR